MAFCAQCGKQLPDNARFCPGCGAASGESDTGTYTTRREEYAGKVIKCPSCGAQLSSFTAICPECGHEINSAKVDASLRDFIAKIDDVDRMIANSPDVSKTGWASWSGGKKFGWVVLNIYTFCIPLIIYLLLPLFKYNRKPRLTAAEKQKAALIENFPFPNGRESIIEALLFIQTKLDFLSSEKLNRHTAYWTRLWATKAKQLEQKADMMLQGDTVAQDACKRIAAYEAKARKRIKLRAILGLIILVPTMCFAGYKIATIIKIPVAEPIAWPTTGIATQIPVPAFSSMNGEISYDTVERFWVEIQDVTDEEYEQYILACQEAGFTIESERTSIEYSAYNADGYELSLTKYLSSDDVDIRVEAPEALGTITWPVSDIAKLIPVPDSTLGRIEWERSGGFCLYVGNIPYEQYKAYVDECVARGFTVDYSRGDDYFHAKNSKGYYVDIDYKGFSVVFIKITAPKDADIASDVDELTHPTPVPDTPLATTIPVETDKPTETPQPTAEHVAPIEKGAVYTFGHDEFSLYCVTAISDSLIKIEKWGKSLSTQKAFSNEYEVGTFRITDTACGFVWLDGEHTAFEFSLQDDDDWDFKKSQKVVFTLSGIDGDTNKGTNYDENGVCYWYENDDWHEYRAMLLSDNLLKIECWYRGIAIGGFNYGYDVVVIDLNAPVMGFEWTDDEHTAFTITLKDEQNSDLKKGTFVSFTLDK